MLTRIYIYSSPLVYVLSTPPHANPDFVLISFAGTNLSIFTWTWEGFSYGRLSWRFHSVLRFIYYKIQLGSFLWEGRFASSARFRILYWHRGFSTSVLSPVEVRYHENKIMNKYIKVWMIAVWLLIVQDLEDLCYFSPQNPTKKTVTM